MSFNSRIRACRDALIVALRAAERAADERALTLVRACLDIVEYLEHQPAATDENAQMALSVLERADAELVTVPARTPAVRAALRKALDKLQRHEGAPSGSQPILSA